METCVDSVIISKLVLGSLCSGQALIWLAHNEDELRCREDSMVVASFWKCCRINVGRGGMQVAPARRELEKGLICSVA